MIFEIVNFAERNSKIHLVIQFTVNLFKGYSNLN